MTVDKKHESGLSDSNICDESIKIEVSPIAKAAQKTASQRNKKPVTAFRTISEVAKDLDVQQHVLRFWETKFSQVKPLKRGGGRRYYRPEDVALIKSIHNLLYVKGYTIKGAQKLLREVGKKQIIAEFSDVETKTEISEKTVTPPKSPANKREILQSVLTELKDLRGAIKSE